jgi:hypothetical protein
VFFAGVIAVLVAYGAWEALGYVRATTGLGEFGYAFALGAATFARVMFLTAVATVIWVPVGVWIGMSPKVTRSAQPIVRVLAGFPANFLFPFATAVFVAPRWPRPGSPPPPPPPRTRRCPTSAPAAWPACWSKQLFARHAGGRYAELYDYDSDDEELTLEPGAASYR